MSIEHGSSSNENNCKESQCTNVIRYIFLAGTSWRNVTVAKVWCAWTNSQTRKVAEWGNDKGHMPHSSPQPENAASECVIHKASSTTGVCLRSAGSEYEIKGRDGVASNRNPWAS